MTATRNRHSTKAAAPLYLAFELGWSEWKLAFATGPADNPRLRTVGARKLPALLQEIALAKRRFGLPEDAPVLSCSPTRGSGAALSSRRTCPCRFSPRTRG